MNGVLGRPRPVVALFGAVVTLSVAAAVTVCGPLPVAEATTPAAMDIVASSAPKIANAAPTDDHAARLALYQARLGAFRLIEARLWAVVPGHAGRRTHVASRHGLPLSRAELAAAIGRSDGDCLAQAVYHEARGEPEAGQAAVAQVVMNRARSGLYPGSICGVVFQGADRPGCQFSFACDGSLRRGVGDATAWSRAQRIATASLGGAGAPGVEAALNYHADYVRPAWAERLARLGGIGRHVFYARGAGAPPGAIMPVVAETRPAAASGL